MKVNNMPVRGTKDYLPQEMAIREYVKSVILKTYQSFGFLQVSTPVLEDIDKLLGSDGGENLKLIFKVLKRGEKLDLSQPNLKEKDIVDIGLKYDQTVPLVRMFCNNQNNLPLPFKSIQIDYSFRADRPQLGRTRQFLQCDIDILGDSSINAEIEILNTTAKTFSALGFKNYIAKVNDRRILSDLIKNSGFDSEDEKEVCISLDKLDKIGVSGVSAELIEKGFDANKINTLLAMITEIQSAGNDFAKVLSKHKVREDVIFDVVEILNSVNALSCDNFRAVFDITIVRGQNYYTGLVYEFFVEGFGGACAGGGRYDGMIEKMSGQAIPAVGLGLGFEPTCLAVMQNKLILAKEKVIAVLYNKENLVDVLKFIQSINSNCRASAIQAKKNVSHQLELLKLNGFTHFCTFADKEIKEL